MKNLTSTLAGAALVCFLSIACEKENSDPINCATDGPTVAATASNASCGNDDGSLQVTGTGGKSPYQYSIDGTTFQAGTNFANLGAGNYTIIIKDANNCTSTATATIDVTEGSVSYESTVKNIIATNCSIGTCHVSGGQAPGDFSQLSVVQSRAAQIKTRTGNHSMPIGRTLTEEQIQQIACWVDSGAPAN
jgi:mono/diheme cytochrome c family protein